MKFTARVGLLGASLMMASGAFGISITQLGPAYNTGVNLVTGGTVCSSSGAKIGGTSCNPNAGFNYGQGTGSGGADPNSLVADTGDGYDSVWSSTSNNGPTNNALLLGTLQSGMIADSSTGKWISVCDCTDSGNTNDQIFTITFTNGPDPLNQTLSMFWAASATNARLILNGNVIDTQPNTAASYTTGKTITFGDSAGAGFFSANMNQSLAPTDPFCSTGGCTNTLQIVVDQTGIRDGAALVEFNGASSGTPEPGTWIMLGSGLCMVAFGIRRRVKA